MNPEAEIIEPTAVTHQNALLNMEMMLIPIDKVGLVIGKGGKTIKSLQNQADVTMRIIQENPQLNVCEKILHITGQPQNREYAKQLVRNLITNTEIATTTQNIIVPQHVVGVIIGKRGEMIKKIKLDSGARIQFQQDDGGGDRQCLLTGSIEQIRKAQKMINDIISGKLLQQNRSYERIPNNGGNKQVRFALPRDNLENIVSEVRENIQPNDTQVEMAIPLVQEIPVPQNLATDLANTQSREYDLAGTCNEPQVDVNVFAIRQELLDRFHEAHVLYENRNAPISNGPFSEPPPIEHVASSWIKYYESIHMFSEANWVKSQLANYIRVIGIRSIQPKADNIEFIQKLIDEQQRQYTAVYQVEQSMAVYGPDQRNSQQYFPAENLGFQFHGFNFDCANDQ